MTRLATTGATLAGAAVAAVLLLGATRVRADAIGPPPESCPAGSDGVSSHSGDWCQATSCATDTDCEQYGRWPEPRRHFVCRQTELCVRDETYTPSQRLAPVPGQPPPTATRAIGVGPCGSACVAPAACTNTKRCVEESTVASVAGGVGRRVGSGCGSCAVGARERTRTAGIAIGVAFLAVAAGLGRAWKRR